MENLEQKQPTQPQSAAGEPTPPPVSQPVSQPLTPEVKPKKSFLLPVLLSLGTLVLGGSLVFAYFTFLEPGKITPQPAASLIPSPSASPDLTAEWESYTNGEHSFSLRYPKDWQADEKQVPDTSIVVTFTKEDFELDLGYGIEIDVRENPQELSSSEWAEAEAKSTGGDVPDLKSKETTVAGVKTFVFSGPLPRWTEEVIYLPYKEKIYIIRAFNNVAKESIVKDLKNTFNLILQTFKFTE